MPTTLEFHSPRTRSTKKLITPATSVSTIEPSKAGINPVTLKPGVKAPAIQILIPFTTNKNNPKVRIVNGSVNTIKIGLTIALTKPITTAAIKAATKFVTIKPLTRLAVISKEIAVTSQVNKKCGMVNFQ